MLIVCQLFEEATQFECDSGGEAVQGAESERDAGQGGGPGLQPPGQRLRALVAVAVA